jgi:3-deoxy-7-phosphoheptulonate synthase
MSKLEDVRVVSSTPLESPRQIKRAFPLSERDARVVAETRNQIEAIVAGRDPRLLVVVGPCSIHDPEAALEYARHLRAAADRHRDSLLLCMRSYFEKPRTNVGWKGLINDPGLDGSCDVARGLRVARELLLSIVRLGLPIATEALDPVTPQYLADLISWSAIGARTTESQIHRELASGLSMPVGFKNGTDGGLEHAINAMKAARAAHSFLGIDADGCVSVVRTAGNPFAHLVLRGGSRGPNYEAPAIAQAVEQLARAGQNTRLLVDCSHANSGKDHERQPLVAEAVSEQVRNGSRAILGVMLESHLVAGRQDQVPGRGLRYGQSITDACIDFAATERVLSGLADAARNRASEWQIARLATA